MCGPPAPAANLNELFDARLAWGGGEGALKEARKADLASGFAGFLKRHGVHAYASYASSAAMGGLVFAWRGGASENPLTTGASQVIDGMAHGIPDGWNALPFVNNVGWLAYKGIGGISLGDGKIVALVDVGDALRVCQGGPCFSAPFGAGDFNGAKESEIAFYLGVHNAWLI